MDHLLVGWLVGVLFACLLVCLFVYPSVNLMVVSPICTFVQFFLVVVVVVAVVGLVWFGSHFSSNSGKL